MDVNKTYSLSVDNPAMIALFSLFLSVLRLCYLQMTVGYKLVPSVSFPSPEFLRSFSPFDQTEVLDYHHLLFNRYCFSQVCFCYWFSLLYS